MARKRDNRGVKKGVKRGAYKKNVTASPVEFEEVKTEMKKDAQPMAEPEKEIKPETTEQPKVEKEPEKKEEPKADTHDVGSLDDTEKFETWRDEYEEIEPPKVEVPAVTKTETPEKVEEEEVDDRPNVNNQLVTGSMLLMFCDLFFPNFIKKLMSWFGDKKAKDVKAKDMKLDPDQREEIQPIADEVAKKLFARIPPELAFAIYMMVCYYMNYQMAREELGE